LYLATLR